MATINQFKANLVGAGPRNNRFEERRANFADN